MSRYYTRVCNFYYGNKSKKLVKEKKTFPLNGYNQISFDKIEIISQKYKKIISVNKINTLPSYIKKKVQADLRLISKKKKIFRYLNLK